jgi:hypothetical protein
MPLDVLPGCAQLAVAADAAAQDGFAGVSEAELVGVLCAWDRVEAHAHARKLAVVAELAGRNPGTLDAEFTADQIAYALGESRARADSLIGMAQTLPARLPGTAAALEDGMISRTRRRSSPGPPRCWRTMRPARPRPGCWKRRPADLARWCAAPPAP